jgi:hypothetical protein
MSKTKLKFLSFFKKNSRHFDDLFFFNLKFGLVSLLIIKPRLFLRLFSIIFKLKKNRLIYTNLNFFELLDNKTNNIEKIFLLKILFFEIKNFNKKDLLPILKIIENLENINLETSFHFKEFSLKDRLLIEHYAFYIDYYIKKLDLTFSKKNVKKKPRYIYRKIEPLLEKKSSFIINYSLQCLKNLIDS